MGFDCESCHPAAGSGKVRWEMDTPRRILARRMTTMVANINPANRRRVELRRSYGSGKLSGLLTKHEDPPVAGLQTFDIELEPPARIELATC